MVAGLFNQTTVCIWLLEVWLLDDSHNLKLVKNIAKKCIFSHEKLETTAN